VAKKRITKVTRENYREVADKCVELTLKLRRPVYFNVAYWESDSISACYFTPIAPVDEKGRRKWYVFPVDYEKLLVMLLTHPRISELQLDEKEGAIKLIFNVPEDYVEKGREEW